ncbi:MAG: alkaline phosphatase [Alistipes sp.]|nr:alkaline phosphatase [Alistipes sp.]MDE7129108.1 alkaline phosphatase [Alistipes sp.]
MKRFFISIIAAATCTCMSAATQNPVRNIIIMIGDGMGLSCVSMIQLENDFHTTVFDRADNIVLTRTYSLNNRVTDSAAAGTALATGHKTDNAHLGITPDGQPVESITSRAAAQGMPTGIVVTTYLQHATPAAFYAHTADRGALEDITRSLTDSGIDVAVGGGRKYFERTYPDGAWRDTLASRGYRVAEDIESLTTLGGSGRVMALLADKELPYDSGDMLAVATAKTLDLLDAESARRGDVGFVAMIEGSMIDYGAHGNEIEKLRGELRSFTMAIEAAVDFARTHEGTLVVVTSDHETGGLAIASADKDFLKSEQGISYRFACEGHTAQMCPVYLYGTGAELVNGIMENSELGAALISIIEQRQPNRLSRGDASGCERAAR